MTAYIGLGSNLGERHANLKAALAELDSVPEVAVVQVSSLYETAPVGVTEQPEFLNAVAEIKTSLDAPALLAVLLHIENEMGRVRTVRWGPRVIDMDLLLYGEQEIALPTLIVPHPRLYERAFVLVPLAEIAPEMVPPGQKKTVGESAKILSGTGNIRRQGFV